MRFQSYGNAVSPVVVSKAVSVRRKITEVRGANTWPGNDRRNGNRKQTGHDTETGWFAANIEARFRVRKPTFLHSERVVAVRCERIAP